MAVLRAQAHSSAAPADAPAVGGRPQGSPQGSPQHQVRLPGFLIEHEVGLGDVIKRATYAMGIRACGGCESRAEALNRWLTFSR